MATCCKCKHYFRVMEDEDPMDFGCPKCGYHPARDAEEEGDEDGQVSEVR